jgi:flagellar secretion chaperone FliS
VNPYSAYATANVMTNEQDKGKILVKVLKALVERIGGVKVLIAQKRYDAKYEELNRITNIIQILNDSLDMSFGEIPKNLSSLYMYVSRRLIEVHSTLDPKTLDECKKIIRDLAEGFEAAEQGERRAKSVAHAEPVRQFSGCATV